MTTLMQASHQWSSRPDDERYTSLVAMLEHFRHERGNSHGLVKSTRSLYAMPAGVAQGNDPDSKGLQLMIKDGDIASPTHYSFGQLASLAGAPGGYLRKLPSPIAADCVNYGLLTRDVEDIGLLVTTNGDVRLRAATGPNYGRIWNADIVAHLVDRFGDGVTGDWTVPGEFGKAVDVSKANTTLYAGDRDMFVFLADEKHRVEVPNRRDGQSGQMARGFFVWNSEVGAATFGVAMFLFDYVCCNRIVWGAEQFQEVRIRHTAKAPDRFLEEIQPALVTYANSSTATLDQAIAEAKEQRIADEVDDFLANRFGKSFVAPMKAVHVLEEDCPIETRWDAVVAATAYARGIKWQDERVAIERQAGKLLDLAA